MILRIFQKCINRTILRFLNKKQKVYYKDSEYFITSKKTTKF